MDHFDNPFLNEAFVRAGDGRVSAGPVDMVQGGGYRLAYTIGSNAFSLGLRFATFWAHGYAPIGGGYLPGVLGVEDAGSDPVRGRNEVDFHAALDALVEKAGVSFLLWPYFPVQAREYDWLGTWLARRRAGRGMLMSRVHDRAVIDTRDDAASQSASGFSVSSKKRRKLNRQHRRLEELGSLEYLSTQDGLGHEEAIAAFLKTEASGWKALKGTALAVDPMLRSFVDGFLLQMLDEGAARIDLMILGSECIAGLVSFRAGRGLFTWKTGMDEVYKRYSPGVHMLLRVSELAVADPGIDYIDSLADANHPMADHIWGGRRRYANLFVPLSGRGRLAAHSFRAGQEGKDFARYWVKRSLGRD